MIQSMSKFLEEQRACLAADRIDEVLRALRDLFAHFATAPALQGRQMNTRIFDELCQQAGSRSAFELHQPASRGAAAPHAVLLLSEVTTEGGHAALAADIARHIGMPVVLAVTNVNNRRAPLLPAFEEDCGAHDIVVADSPSLLKKLQAIQTVLHAPGVEQILVLTHSYDAVGIAAITAELAPKTSYLHHCDHYPTLGSCLPGVAHVDLHNIGANRCRHQHDQLHNRYLCLTSEAAPIAPLRRFSSPCFTSVTCGADHKLNATSYPFTYRDVVLAVLKQRGGVHFHVGHLSDATVSGLRAALEAHGLAQEQFSYLGPVPGFAQLLPQLDPDLYIPTLPHSGGKAIIDAMAAGVPVLVHQHAMDRLWGSIDLAYPEALSWSTLAELEQALARLDEASWLEQCAASARYFRQFHHPDTFRRQLQQRGIDAGSAAVPPLKSYQPDVVTYLRQLGAEC